MGEATAARSLWPEIETARLAEPRPAEAAHDNSPPQEVGCTGTTCGGEGEGFSLIYREVISRLKKEHEMQQQNPWTAADGIHAERYVVLHEVGEKFGLADDESGNHDNVMWAPRANHNEDEDGARDVPLSFTVVQLAQIRGASQP